MDTKPTVCPWFGLTYDMDYDDLTEYVFNSLCSGCVAFGFY